MTECKWKNDSRGTCGEDECVEQGCVQRPREELPGYVPQAEPSLASDVKQVLEDEGMLPVKDPSTFTDASTLTGTDPDAGKSVQADPVVDTTKTTGVEATPKINAVVSSTTEPVPVGDSTAGEGVVDDKPSTGWGKKEGDDDPFN